MFDIVLKNCKFINSSQEHYLGINKEKIGKISKNPIEGEKIIDIKGNLVFPGFIDPHVHFRDPGLTKKEDFRSGSLSAANGGFTTIIDMPNNIPKTNTYKSFKEKTKIAKEKSIVNFKLNSGVNNLEEMKKIVSLNPASFKVFMDLKEDAELEKIFKNLGRLKKETNYNGLISVHTENKKIIQESTEKFKAKKEEKTIDYSYGRPIEGEDTSVKQAISLSVKNNLNLHICHLSSKNSLIAAKKAKNILNISWEFTPHHLLLNNSFYNEYGTILKTNPPLREKKDKININDIDENTIIGTDHAPHTLEEKNKGVWNSSPGIPNLETVVPLILTEVNKGNLDLRLIPKILSENAAKVFGLTNKGSIKVGKDADLTIVNLKKEGKFNIDSFKTKAKYSPFNNWKYIGEPIMTIVMGKVVVSKI